MLDRKGSRLVPIWADIGRTLTIGAAALAASSGALAVSPLPPCWVEPWNVNFTSLGISYGYESPVAHHIEVLSGGQVQFHTFGSRLATAPYRQRQCQALSTASLKGLSGSAAESVVVSQTRRVMACERIAAGPRSPLARLNGQGANFRKAFAMMMRAVSKPNRPIDWSRCAPTPTSHGISDAQAHRS